MFLAAITAAIIASFLFEHWLDRRQIRHVLAHQDRVPTAFQGAVSIEDHQKAAAYTVAKRRFGMNSWSRNVIQDRLEQGCDIAARFIDVQRRNALNGGRVNNREIELFIRRTQVDKQVKRSIEHVVNDGIGSIDLVDHDDSLVSERQCLPKDKGRLRHRAFLRIDQQQHAFNHAQGPFYFSAEVGMPRRIDDIDLDALISDARVLGPDRDAALTLLIHRVHNAFAHVVDLPMDVRLPEHRVDQGGFAMVDVGNNGDVANVGPLTKRSAPDFLNGVGCHMCIHNATLYVVETKKKTPTDAASTDSIVHDPYDYKPMQRLEFSALSL